MNSNTWWGDYSFEQQQQRCWQVGARVIILKRLANEWNSWNIEADEEFDEPIVCKDNCSLDYDESRLFGRYLQQKTSETIKVLPLLADLKVGIAYKEDIAKVREILLSIAEKRSHLFRWTRTIIYSYGFRFVLYRYSIFSMDKAREFSGAQEYDAYWIWTSWYWDSFSAYQCLHGRSN